MYLIFHPVGSTLAIDRLTLLKGQNPVSEFKAMRGYRYEADNFGAAWLTSLSTQLVHAPRVKECLVHLEARFVEITSIRRTKLAGCY